MLPREQRGAERAACSCAMHSSSRCSNSTRAVHRRLHGPTAIVARVRPQHTTREGPSRAKSTCAQRGRHTVIVRGLHSTWGGALNARTHSSQMAQIRCTRPSRCITLLAASMVPSTRVTASRQKTNCVTKRRTARPAHFFTVFFISMASRHRGPQYS